MAWLQLRCDTDAASAEALTDALMEAGALSAGIEDADAGTPEETPQFGEPGMDIAAAWDHSRIAALFEADADAGAVLAACCAGLGLPTPPFTLETVEEQNWVQLTQSQFDPIRVSDKLWIVPSWHETPAPDAINLILDPGMAFGTGSHPTTRLCLEWLERYVTADCSLLDYGCGSGILAIAAARLGANPVTGVDIDPQAVDAAKANAERNGVSAHFADSREPIDGQFDILIANILANPLKALAPALAAHVRPGGWLALSGILVEQEEELMAIYSPWFAMAVADRREGWVCLEGRRI
ncbi:50S ribosomal protein L11 methyltransferase [Azospira sp. APE16]|jgi:ribosomal protein L11 methyltransferase|uniref:Ribosomal protein L11 methyltransferase n=1 Tax=Azospira oryzae (strain ATCC BAA-33 / DSM 13638 / PS) TaxID=640081 RepID=G8QP05_AZOOP|nr:MULTISPECIES: 50S ribosomal protein L11 methyltransferase [Azospira]AEV24804.1 ribosomal protein L11 methyltransferase [Azospira oryzae PS]MBP7488470.1 50S ribosomal protein L11 methyltransferase [Azospira sp.]TLS19842.1 MAG: 50S ribosomal protein L11 methyltransferase [Betaproteobacteria bacterium]BBN88952.1 ribosomal protein L11 methyltransferase [Azospira sp. I09]